MGFRTSAERERLSRSRSSQSCMSSSSGLLRSWRTARRSSALRPLMARSISNNASRRLTASSAIGETGFAFPSILLDVNQLEEAPPRMGKAKRRRNRPYLLLRVEQRLEAVVAIGLQNAGEGGQ